MMEKKRLMSADGDVSDGAGGGERGGGSSGGGGGGEEKWQSYVPDFFRARASGSKGDGQGGGQGVKGGGQGGVDALMRFGKFRICSMFVKLADFRVARRHERGRGMMMMMKDQQQEIDLEALNWSFNVLRREVHRLGGYVDVLLCDDKGFIFKAVFGLPGASVKNDSCEMRGVLCALRFLSAFRARRRNFTTATTANIGLAAGRVGGSSTRITAKPRLDSSRLSHRRLAPPIDECLTV